MSFSPSGTNTSNSSRASFPFDVNTITPVPKTLPSSLNTSMDHHHRYHNNNDNNDNKYTDNNNIHRVYDPHILQQLIRFIQRAADPSSLPVPVREVWGFGDFFLGDVQTPEACLVVVTDGSPSPVFVQFRNMARAAAFGNSASSIRRYLYNTLNTNNNNNNNNNNNSKSRTSNMNSYQILSRFALWSRVISGAGSDRGDGEEYGATVDRMASVLPSSDVTYDAVLVRQLTEGLPAIRVVQVCPADQGVSPHDVIPSFHRIQLLPSSSSSFILDRHHHHQHHHQHPSSSSIIPHLLYQILSRPLPDLPSIRTQELVILLNHLHGITFQRSVAFHVFGALRSGIPCSAPDLVSAIRPFIPDPYHHQYHQYHHHPINIPGSSPLLPSSTGVDGSEDPLHNAVANCLLSLADASFLTGNTIPVSTRGCCGYTDIRSLLPVDTPPVPPPMLPVHPGTLSRLRCRLERAAADMRVLHRALRLAVVRPVIGDEALCAGLEQTADSEEDRASVARVAVRLRLEGRLRSTPKDQKEGWRTG